MLSDVRHGPPVREHMVDPQAGRDAPQMVAAEELIEIVHQYLKK
jgi:hypothetical protein